MADVKLRYCLRIESGDLERLRFLAAEKTTQVQQLGIDSMSESAVARMIFRRGLDMYCEEAVLAQFLRVFRPVKPGSGENPETLLIFAEPAGFPLDEYLEALRIAGTFKPQQVPPIHTPVLSRDLALRLAQPLMRMLLTDSGTEFLIELFGYKRRER